MIDRHRILAISAAATLVATAASAQPSYQHLLDDLQSPREATRAGAARAIGTSGHPDAATMLVPALADPSNSVQLEAIDGLLTLALAPPPDPALARSLRASGGSIAWSVFDLGPLAVLPREWPPHVLPHLAAALADEDGRVRVAAAGALAVLGSAAVHLPSTATRDALAGTLVGALRHPDARTRGAVARAAGAVFTAPRGDVAVPAALGEALIGALNDSDADVRIAAGEALGWVRELRAGQALRDRFVFFRSGDEAQSALHALARMAGPTAAGGTDRAVPDGARVARTGSAAIFREALARRDPPLRVIAAEGLGRLGDRSAGPALAAAMQAERNEPVLLAMAFASYMLGARANLDRLVRALASPSLSRQARAYLTELGPRVAPDLHPWLRDANPVVRRAVAEVIGLSGHAASEAALQDVARTDGDRTAAEAARQAVIRLRALPAGARTR